MTNEEMNEGLDCYSPETRVFPEIAKKAERGQELSQRDILLILKWKLTRIKDKNSKTVSKEKLNDINQAVKKSREVGFEIDSLEELDEIPGIGLATATAILTVCYPDRFTIIDQRALETLGLSPADTADWTAKQYFNKYLPKVEDCRRGWGCTLRQADRALWGLSVSKRVKEIIVKSNQD